LRQGQKETKKDCKLTKWLKPHFHDEELLNYLKIMLGFHISIVLSVSLFKH
jgi:hypothetical protein